MLAAGPSVSSQLLGSGLIGLREGLETAIVVTILVAFLVKSDRRDALKWVWLGVGAAHRHDRRRVPRDPVSAQNTISGLGAEAIAGIASLIAVAIVTTMVLWMKKAAASISGELRGGHGACAGTGGRRRVSLAFLAVGREGVETALFMVGYAEAKTAWPLIGLVVGVLVAVAIAYGMYMGAVRINLAKFFKYTGAFLIVVAAGILSYGIGALQTVGLAARPVQPAFDISSWFDWSSWYGEVVQGVFNVTPTPTVLQFIGWLTYLVIVLALFLRPTTGAEPPAPTRHPPADDSPLQPHPKGRPREPHSLPRREAGIAAAAALLAGVSLTSCTAKESTTSPEQRRQAAPAEITVAASDTDVRAVRHRSGTGANTFTITNNGTKVTEFYVYGEGDRVMGEVENISPGLSRKLIVQLTEPGTYQTACKPGMIGDGIRGDFKVTGDTVQIDTEGKFKEASDSYKRYVNSQTEALVAADAGLRRGRQDQATSTRPRRSSRSPAPTTSASSPSRSRSPTTSTRASTSARPTWSPARSGPASTPREAAVGHRPAARRQRARRSAGRRRQGAQRTE